MFVFSVKVRVAIAFSLVVFVGLLDIRYAQYHAYVASYLLVGSFGISFRLKNIRLTWSSSKRGMKIFLERRPTLRKNASWREQINGQYRIDQWSVFLRSRVTGACPVTTDLIMRVNVRTTVSLS